MAAMIGARWSKYPDPADFDEIASYVQRFSMLTGAKITDAIARGMYLFERPDPSRERLGLLRSIVALEGVSSFIWLSPGGYLVLDSTAVVLEDDKNKIKMNLSTWSRNHEADQDRSWIMATNWQSSELQHAGHINAWAAHARSKFSIWVHPRYLSGLDWYWIADIEKRIGISQFQSNPDFIYILFLRILEKFQRESVSLRLSVEPVARKGGLDDFFDWLAENFGPSSLAFTRLFLSPETILKLRLAGNYTAAITARTVLLEKGVVSFGFLSGILSEEDLIQEQESLTATLSRMSVGARQFEIPWATLKVDANARNRDTYSTHIAMLSAIDDAPNIQQIKKTSSYPFSNGAAIDYEAVNKDRPLIFVIAGIIDTFLTHPSAGIESLLSVRIRHDSFRREFSYALAAVRESEIEGVRQNSLRKTVGGLEQGVYAEIQTWLDSRMHTWRKDKPQALFELTPTKQEMTALLNDVRSCDALDKIIDIVFKWLGLKLDDRLTEARFSLEKVLYPAIDKRIDLVMSPSKAKAGNDDEGTLIAKAFKSAIFRRVTELDEWFKVPSEDRHHSLTVREVIQAVEQRFWPDVSTGKIRIDQTATGIDDRTVSPGNIRPLYDLLSELVRNALKHSKLGKTRVCIKLWKGTDHDFISISNLRKIKPIGDAGDRCAVVSGHPSTTRNAALFAEGKSGRDKIAYLSAYLAGKALDVSFVRGIGGFHVLIPAEAVGGND